MASTLKVVKLGFKSGRGGRTKGGRGLGGATATAEGVGLFWQEAATKAKASQKRLLFMTFKFFPKTEVDVVDDEILEKI